MSVGGAKAPSAWPGKTAVDDARTMLTRPSKPCQNNFDNENWDLIIRVGDEFVASSGIRCGGCILPQMSSHLCRYQVCGLLGQGTFGQVVKCWCDRLQRYVAVKVVVHEAMAAVCMHLTMARR